MQDSSVGEVSNVCPNFKLLQSAVQDAICFQKADHVKWCQINFYLKCVQSVKMSI